MRRVLPWLHTALAENRKGNSQSKRGPYLQCGEHNIESRQFANLLISGPSKNRWHRARLSIPRVTENTLTHLTIASALCAHLHRRLRRNSLVPWGHELALAARNSTPTESQF